jgi:hypothetical protein
MAQRVISRRRKRGGRYRINSGQTAPSGLTSSAALAEPVIAAAPDAAVKAAT